MLSCLQYGSHNGALIGVRPRSVLDQAKVDNGRTVRVRHLLGHNTPAHTMYRVNGLILFERSSAFPLVSNNLVAMWISYSALVPISLPLGGVLRFTVGRVEQERRVGFEGDPPVCLCSSVTAPCLLTIAGLRTGCTFEQPGVFKGLLELRLRSRSG